MSNNSDKVKNWRKNTKIRMIESMGGSCQICGYNKCNDALELHHIDPSIKEFSFGQMMANPKKWDDIVNELKKCILLCCRCHREFHAGLINLPKDYQQFDEEKIITNKPIINCYVCGKETLSNKVCSKQCAAKIQNTIPWDEIDLLEELKTQTVRSVASKFNINIGSISKRLKKLGTTADEVRAKYPEVHINGIRVSAALRRKVKNRPSAIDLQKLIESLPLTHVGKLFGVSDNCIRKWCSAYNITIPKREAGYWQKLKSGSGPS